MDLSNSVIIPKEDFYELETAAYTSPPTTTASKVGTTVQFLLFFAAATAAGSAMSWQWAKANDWLDEKQTERKLRLAAETKTTRKSPTVVK